jgi:hypothetical protein
MVTTLPSCAAAGWTPISRQAATAARIQLGPVVPSPVSGHETPSI